MNDIQPEGYALPMEALLPREQRFRVLLPFRLGRNSLAATESSLQAVVLAGHKRDWNIWEKPAEPPSLYLPDAWPLAADFLFGQGKSCCRYLRMPAGTANYLFKNGVQVEEPRGKTSTRGGESSRENDSTRLNLVGEGIELFLSPFQSGVLSITLACADNPSLINIKRLNYRLSQRRRYTMPFLRLEQGERSPTAPPPDDAALTDRLGAPGGGFTLAELTDWLLTPLATSGYAPTQHQFSLFEVIRFGAEVDFSRGVVRKALRPLLIALTHIEEHDHAGSLAIRERLLNACHWTGVSTLATAHLIADQPFDHPFNTQRTAVVLYRYFVPYLLALMQRQSLQHLLLEADGADDFPESAITQRQDAIRALHRDRVRFSVKGYFSDISSREALNQYYEVAQAGLRVPESMQMVHMVLHDLETCAEMQNQQRTSEELNQLAEGLTQQVDAVVAVQSKVEWLEVFFVSYYATSLVHYVGEANFSHSYNQWSLIVAPVFSGLLALWGIKPYQVHRPGAGHQPDQSHEPAGKGKAWLFLVVLLTAFALWTLAGLAWCPGPSGH